EWFGDEIEQIRTFDPATQRSLRRHERLHVHPARESMVTDASRLRDRLLALGDELQLPSRITRAAYESLRDGVEFFGQEALIPLLHEEMQAAWTYLPADTTWIVEQPEELSQVYTRMLESYHAQHAAAVDAQQLAVGPESFFVSADTLGSKLADADLRFSSAVENDDGELDSVARDRLIRVFADSNLRLKTQLDGARARESGDVITPLATHIKGLGRGRDGVTEHPWDVVLVAANATQQSQLTAMLEARDVQVQSPEAPDDVDIAPLELSAPTELGACSRVRVVVGRLTHGFTSEEDRVLVITDSELFGHRTRRHRKGARNRRVGSLAQLNVDDFVVHFLHGIGRYSGIIQMTVNGVSADFVRVDYAGSD
ncbi:MAG: CarD family transcriptional regulator, partial [Nannocystaceae bacterium]